MSSRLSQPIRTLALAVHNRSLGLGLCLVLFLAIALPAFGQEATIVGTVTDPSGSVVPNVAITITRVETGDVNRVLDGDIDMFIRAFLLARRTGFAEPVEAEVDDA